MLEVFTTVGKDQKVLGLVGELDIETVDNFKQHVEEARVDLSCLVLDMSALSFVDSTGVGGLLNVVRSLTNDNISVKVRNVSAELYEVFELLGLPMLFGNEVFE